MSKDSPALMLSLPAGVATDADDDVYDDPAFKDAFNSIPNRCSNKALALFMSLKGFHENLSKTTVESIHSAFKKLWELLDGDRFRGKWHFNEAKQCWEGNPADSADVYDVLSSVKHKANTLMAPGHVSTRDRAADDLEGETPALRWQWKVDKGQWEVDLRLNHYKIYPHPDMLACDNFFWMLVWIKWLEYFRCGRSLQPNDFIFPAMGASRVVQPGQPISHDMVQKWINEATTGAGILGNFSTHCFHRRGAQYWFMFAPVAQHTHSLPTHKLHAYKNDYSDALAPISHGADTSLAGEQALMRLASIEELCMVHSSVMTDVNNLCNDIRSIHNSLCTLTNVMVQAACTTATALQLQGDSSRHFAIISDSQAGSCTSESCMPRPTPLYTPSREGGHLAATHHPSPRAITSQNSILTSQQPTTTKTTQPSNNTTSQSLPTPGLVIPRVPVTHPNGTTSPKSKSWKDIIEHWLIGNPDRGLRMPLKDWPKEWYELNESHFLIAYPEAEMGHMQLLRAINEARAALVQRISRKK
ncbi:hypothetical protein EDB19DRAFT_1951960 [Suillus lakei]|nr:hypothetical protein EDB19DRAFT_1951960 [Suillus lakei]